MIQYTLSDDREIVNLLFDVLNVEDDVHLSDHEFNSFIEFKGPSFSLSEILDELRTICFSHRASVLSESDLKTKTSVFSSAELLDIALNRALSHFSAIEVSSVISEQTRKAREEKLKRERRFEGVSGVLSYGYFFLDGKEIKSVDLDTNLPIEIGSLDAIDLQVYDLDGNEQMVKIGSGLTIIFGATGSGKTTAALKLVELLPNAEFVSFGEPDTCSIFSVDSLAEKLNKDKDKIWIIDSARLFLFQESKSTGTGGINNEIYLRLSEMSSNLAKDGRFVFLTLNPMSDKIELINLMKHNLEGSVSNVMSLGIGDKVFLTSRYENRREEQVFRLMSEQQIKTIKVYSQPNTTVPFSDVFPADRIRIKMKGNK